MEKKRFLMDKQRRQLIDFAEHAKGLDDAARLKLILFAAGAKPATFIALKISPANLEEKAHLESHLKATKVLFIAGKPRSYEEITGIRGNKIKWEIKGSWYGYDLFADRKHLVRFNRYTSLLNRQKHSEADRIAGNLYGYPECCIKQYITEHLHKNRTHHINYLQLRRIERAFPLVQHSACSAACRQSKELNNAYAAALRKSAPEFWKQFSAARKHRSDVIVDTESGSAAGKMRQYSLITLKRINRHYWILSHITGKRLERGTVLPAAITMQYNYADVLPGKPKRLIKNLHHERKFVVK